MKGTKGCIGVLVAILLLGGGTSHALTGLGLGLRAGTVTMDDPNTEESVDGMTMVGGHLKIGTLPIIDLEASGEYAWKDYEYTEDIPAVGDQRVEVTYHHFSLNGSAKYNFSLPAIPIKPYVGAGLGMHFIGSSVKLPDVPYDIPLEEDFTESKTGLHGLAGLSLSFPLFPLEIFAEGRYSAIFTKDKSTKATSLYAGLTLKLP
jgi:opacity protein-like surface antigen